MCYTLLAGVAVTAPQLLFMSGGVGYSLAAVFLIRALIQARQGFKLVRYQRGLFVLPPYIIHPDTIVRSKESLNLGLGFEWTAQHTQRRADISRPSQIERLKHGFVYKHARRLIDKAECLTCSTLVSPFNSQSLLNPFPPIPYVEGSSDLHAVGLYEKEIPVAIRQSERVAHMLVLGTTRVGKTRLLEVLVTQDIHNGDVVIVFDPKGDGELLARLHIEAQKAGRLDDLKIFHLGFPSISARYNPSGSYGRITEIATRIAGQLPTEGNSSIFKDFAWRYINAIAKAVDALGYKMTYKILLRYSTDIDALIIEYISWVFKQKDLDAWEEKVTSMIEGAAKLPQHLKGRSREAWVMTEVFKDAHINDATAQSLIKTFENDKTHFDKLVASLYPLLEKLTSGSTADILSPDYNNHEDPRPIFEWTEVINSGGIVYVGLDALSDPEVAAAVGNSMFADLTSVAGHIYKTTSKSELPTISIHADEFNELAGNEFIPLLNKGGGAGFQLTVYTQTLSDIIARFDSTAKAGQVIGNLGTLVMLRVKEEATVQLLTSRLKEVEINELMVESGATDNSNPESDEHFVSNTRQRITTTRVPMIEPGDLDALPKGHAFALIAGRLYKLRLPQLSDEKELSGDIEEMVGKMKKAHVAGGS